MNYTLEKINFNESILSFENDKKTIETEKNLKIENLQNENNKLKKFIETNESKNNSILENYKNEIIKLKNEIETFDLKSVNDNENFNKVISDLKFKNDNLNMENINLNNKLNNYELKEISAFSMFPRTKHCEMIILFERR